MKKYMVIVLVLLLSACGNEEMKHELATMTTKVESLEKQKAELETNLKEVGGELEDLRKVSSDAEGLKKEMEDLRARADEVDKLNEKLKDYNQKEQKLAELQKTLREVGKDAEKMKFLTEQMKGVTATLVTNHGEIKLKFYPELAPIHCYNFLTRAECGYYDKTQFHRVIPGFMIQGGDSKSRDMDFNDDGSGGTFVSIPHEFNSKHHGRGILSMARRGDTRFGAGSQFFIMHADSPNLNNQYTVFGEVESGMDVVDKIASVPKNRRDHPLEPVWIESVKLSR